MSDSKTKLLPDKAPGNFEAKKSSKYKPSISLGCKRKIIRNLDKIYESLSEAFNVHGGKEPSITIIRDLIKNEGLMPSILSKELKSYSQYGEDIIIQSIMHARQKKRFESREITYCDVGANNPINMNNTWLFYKMGMRGVLIEPNPHLVRNLRLVRSEDNIIEGVIDPLGRSYRKFFIPIHNELGSLKKKFIDDYYIARNLGDPEIKSMRVKSLNINDIFRHNFKDGVVDLINIDVETVDFSVLKSIDFSSISNTVICIEPSDEFEKHRGVDSSKIISDYLEEKGYNLHSKTPANLIFVSN